MNKLIVTIFAVLIYSGLYAQGDSVLKRNINALENYAASHPVEKVHLHVDRQLYFPGDTIWFESYVVVGQEHKLSAFSEILYAELINPKDSVIKRITLGLQNGTAPGDFELPYDATPGNYRIRAYTNWMRNFGPEYFFDQQVPVSGFSTPPAMPVAASGIDNVDLQFFPEGGDLINGLRSKVAFKAINQNGMAEEVQGSILDDLGNEVATFNSQHLGMGVFPLAPEAGKTYFAKVTAADGSKFSVPLPVAKKSGYTLTLNNNPGDSLYVKIAAKNVSDSSFYLLAQQDGQYAYAASGKVTDKPFVASIPKNKFSTGIVQFTLFSQAGEPENERIVFIQNDDQLHLTISTDKQNYVPGGEVKLNVEAKDNDGKPAVGTFSVAVVDESKVPVNEQSESTIFTDLLLKSEISGYVQNPNYYFINPNEQTKAGLDLLMLTQGYRRFEWKEILKKGAGVLPYHPEKGFTISGKVNTPTGKPVADGKVFLTSTKHGLVLDTLTNSAGHFSFPDIMLTDTAKLVINAKKANGGENVVLKIDKPVYAPISSFYSEKGYVANHFMVNPEQIQEAYKRWKQDSLGHVIMLKEVKIKDHKIPPLHPDYPTLLKHSENLNGAGQADQVIMSDELQPSTSLSASLAAKLRGGVRLVCGPSGCTIFSTHTPIELTGSTKPMAVLVNGILQDQSILNELNMADIQGFEMLESPMYSAIYGSAGYGGVIVVTLKYGDEANYIFPLQSGLTLYNSPGFYKGRQFYSPKYTLNHTVTLADNRRTIFWDNALQTDEKGLKAVSYFNAGDKGNYVVAVEGLDGSGRLAWQILRYKVELNN